MVEHRPNGGQAEAADGPVLAAHGSSGATARETEGDPADMVAFFDILTRKEGGGGTPVAVCRR
jgi:hypothetical protein